MRPAHLHFKVAAPGYRTLITHIFVAGDPYLDRDAVFGVKQSLITDFAEHPAGGAPWGRVTAEEWFDAVFDIVLAPDEPPVPPVPATESSTERSAAKQSPATQSTTEQLPAEHPPTRVGEPR